MAEHYIRPPVVASEAPSERAAVWRFRGYLIAGLLVLAVGIFFIAKAIIGSPNDNPNLGGTLAPMHTHEGVHSSRLVA